MGLQHPEHQFESGCRLLENALICFGQIKVFFVFGIVRPTAQGMFFAKEEMRMETMIALAGDEWFFQIVNWIDLVLGIGLCFFAGRIKPKVTVGIVGVYTGAEIGSYVGMLSIDHPASAVLGAVWGALLFASVNWGISRGEDLILGFVAGVRTTFAIIYIGVTEPHVGFELLYGPSIDLAVSVLAGIVAAAVLYFGRKEIHMAFYRCLCSLIGSGWLLGGLYFMFKSMDYIESDLLKFSQPVDFLLPLMKLEFDESFLFAPVLMSMLFIILFYLIKEKLCKMKRKHR